MSARKSGGQNLLTKVGDPVPAVSYDALVSAIEKAHQATQRQAAQAVNVALTLRNWLIGYHIVEYEQHGSDHARYGERLLDNLSKDLRKRLGKGFGKRYLEMFRQFYLRYSFAKTLFSQFCMRLPHPASISLTPLEWQDDAYFARLFRDLTWLRSLGGVMNSSMRGA